MTGTLTLTARQILSMPRLFSTERKNDRFGYRQNNCDYTGIAVRYCLPERAQSC